MLQKQEIISKVREILNRKKIHSTFFPIIQEFFIRSTEQQNWTQEELQVAINRYDNAKIICFDDLSKKNLLGNQENKTYAINSLDLNTGFSYIRFDMYFLKGILEYDISKIEEFINYAMHEFGHVTQIQKIDENTWQTGIAKIKRLRENNVQSTGTIINEFAEIINAERLQKGNLLSHQYRGYEDIQPAGRMVVYSLGMIEEELANLQFKGRKSYQDVAQEKTRNISVKQYIEAFEDLLDKIYTFSRR